MEVLEQKRFTVRQAAERTGMSQAWWRTQIRERKVLYIKVGGKFFIPEESVETVFEVIEPTKPADEAIQHQTREI